MNKHQHSLPRRLEELIGELETELTQYQLDNATQSQKFVDAVKSQRNALRNDQRKQLPALSQSVLGDMLAIAEWQEYTGDYEKQYYDIKLWSGEVYEQCWPNANTFHEGVIGKVIDGKDVAYIRVNPSAALTAYCIGEGGKPDVQAHS